MPPIGEFLELLSDSGVKLWGCKLGIEIYHLTKKVLIDDLAAILTIGDFYRRCESSDTHMPFV